MLLRSQAPLKLCVASIPYLFYIKAMNYIDLQEIKLLSAHLDRPGALQEILTQGCQNYGINLTFDQGWDVHSLAAKLNERETWKMVILKEKREENKPEHWMFGELQVFICILLIYSHKKDTTLAKFGQEDFQYINSIFLQKSLDFIRYETALLANTKQSKIKTEWREEEMAIVREIVGQKIDDIEWRSVSFNLFQQSNGRFVRCQKECREKWRNYLNPNIKKGQWTPEQDQKLEELIAKYDHKWSQIAKHFKGERTEHMVKNRYNSLNKTWRGKNKEKKSRRGKKDKVKNDKIEDPEIYEVSAIMEEDENEVREKEKEAESEHYSLLSLPQPHKEQPMKQKDPEMSFDYLQASNYFQKKIISNSYSIYDNFLKKTSDEDEDENQFKISYQPRPLWEISGGLKQPQNGAFESIFSMEGEVKKTAIDDIVSALGCTHYERIFGSWDEEDPSGHFEWIE